MKGMNLRNQLFPELGNILASRNQYGKKRFFEMKLDQGYAQDINFLWLSSGLETDSIDVMLPFDQMEKNFSTFYSSKANGVTIMHSDGETITWLKDPITMLPLVSKHRAIVPILEWGIRTGDVVPYREITRWGADIEVKTSRKAFLKVLIPEWKRLSYLTILLSQEHDIESLIRHLEAIENASTGTLTNIPMTLKFNVVPFQRKHGKVYKDSVVINAYPDTLSNDFDAEIYRSQLSEIYTFGIFDSSVSSTNALQQEAEEYYEL